MPAKKMTTEDLEAVEVIAKSYAEFSVARRTVEAEVRREVQSRLDTMEGQIAVRVLEAMARPGVTNAAIMRAIGKQNPDRWKAWLEKWEHLKPLVEAGREEAQKAGPILEEVTQVEIPRLPDAPWYAMGGKVRAFRLREWKNPNSNRKAREPHADIIVYQPEPIHVRQDWDNGPVANPSWANDIMAPLGEHADEIIEAVQRWVEEHPEVER